MLNGQGGAPSKLKPIWLDTAERIARESPCTLAEIDRRLREINPDVPTVHLATLARQLKKTRPVVYPDAIIVEKT